MTQHPLPYDDLTLEQALEAFRIQYGLADKYQAMREEAREHYERHDMVHVLFGLDTSMAHEAQADGWTLFGTDISRQHIREFFGLPEEKELVAQLGLWSIAKGYVGAIPEYFRIAWRSRRLMRKWRWSDNAAYRSKPVDVIRREFGIDRVLAS